MVWLQKYEGYGARRDSLLETGLTWFRLESTLLFRVRQNNRLFLSVSSNLQPWFKVWLCCFFYRELTKLAPGVSFFVLVASAVATVGPGAPYPRNDCLWPPFRFTQNVFLEHHVSTRQQAIMEKGTIIFKHNSRLKFSLFFAKSLAINCFT